MDQTLRRRFRVGAYVLCVREGSLLLTRFRGSGRWTLPGGGLDFGECPEDAAVREVEEETGHQIELGALIDVHSARWMHEIEGEPVDHHTLHILYTGEIIGGTLRDETNGSSDRAAWISLAELAALPHTSTVDVALAAAGTTIPVDA